MLLQVKNLKDSYENATEQLEKRQIYEDALGKTNLENPDATTLQAMLRYQQGWAQNMLWIYN